MYIQMILQKYTIMPTGKNLTVKKNSKKFREKKMKRGKNPNKTK